MQDIILKETLFYEVSFIFFLEKLVAGANGVVAVSAYIIMV